MNDNYLMSPQELSKPEKDISKDKYDFSFITTDEHLKGLLSNICNVLKHPITIININKNDDDINSCRLDSDSIYYALRRSCETLRRCASSNLCKECDKFHASILKGLTKDNIKIKLENLTKQLPHFKYSTSLYSAPKVLTGKDGRVFLSYNCPMLGYRELIFPIFFEDKVIAAFFVGQIKMYGDKSHLLMTEAFLEQHKYVFDKYLRVVTNSSYDKIAKELKKSSFKSVAQNKFVNIFNEPVGSINDIQKNNLTKKEFLKLVDNVCEQLNVLEDFLERHMETKRKNFFSDIIRNNEQVFYKEINPVDLSEENFRQVRKCFAKYLSGINSAFKINEMCAFYDDELTVNPKNENIIYPILDSHEQIKAKHFKFKKVKQFINSNQYLPTSSTDVKSLFLGFQNKPDINSDKYILLAFPKLAVLISVVGFKSEHKKEIFNIMLLELSQSLSRIYFSIQNLYLGYFKSKYQLTLRLYKHECQHISKGLANKNKKYFFDKDYIGLNRKKSTDIYNDLNSSISLMNGMASSIGLIIGSVMARDIQISTESVSVFKDILYKWTDMFELPLSEKNIQIVVPEVSKFDEDRPLSITTNKELLEQVVYNIVDNAVKYAYWGSKIHIDFKRPYKNSYIGVLSVTNYTPHYIEQGEVPYELYYRGESTKGRVEGEGIGLFVTKKISEMFDMHLYHTIEKISSYGVPLIEEYISRNFSYYSKNDKLINALKLEIARLTKKGNFWRYSDIVNERKTTPVSDIDIAEETIFTYIEKPTYKVTFNIDIKIKD